MTVAIASDAQQSGWLKIDLAGDATVAGALGEVLNPEGVLLQISRAYLYLSVGATGAATWNIGVGATGADTSDLAAALAVNTTGVIAIVGLDLTSEGKATTPQGLEWPADEYLQITNAAVASTGLVGSLFVEYIRLGLEP